MSATHLFARLREPGSPSQLAAVRILFSAHLLGVLASPAIPLLREIGATPHPQAHTLLPGDLFSGAVVDLARTAGLVAAVCSLLGLATRVAIPALLACFFVTQHYWFATTVFHDDWLYFTFFLLVLCFAPAGDAWSVDAWIRRRPPPPRPPQAYRWPIELMVFWLGFVYLAAGLAKILPLQKGVLWLTGAPAQLFAQEFVRDSPLFWLLGHAPFDLHTRWPFTVAAAATAVVELGAVALWFTRRAYAPLFVALLGMHASIWLLGIPGFVQIFVVSGIVLLPPQVFARLDARWSRGRAPA